jgi:putative photosynthetic complex assembly protein 2
MEASALASLGLPLAFAAFLWWFSTGVVLMLDGLPPTATRWSLALATVAALAALVGLRWAAQLDTVAASYAAFACAIVVWGWQELAFLTGWITGPRRHGCAPGCRGAAHFVHALHAILYHELAILGIGMAIALASLGGANQTGTWTFLVLWGMRVSAKLNLFLGVRNTGEEFLPERLAYLRSYFSHRPMNLLFPFSVSVATVIATLVVQRAFDPAETPAASAGLLLAGTLLALGILEHWLMVLPVRVSALWEWAMRTHRRARGIEPPGPLGPIEIAPPRGY